MQSTLELPSLLNRESTLREWTADPHGMSILAPIYPQINAEMQTKFGRDDREQTGLDPLGFLMDMPLPGLLYFLRFPVPSSPEDMVDELLAKVYSSA
jgi:beta-glucosidase